MTAGHMAHHDDTPRDEPPRPLPRVVEWGPAHLRARGQDVTPEDN